MLQVARMAPHLLRDSSDLVRDFLLGQLAASGGFRDRDDRPDLYYTVFGIDGLVALRVDPPLAPLSAFVDGFGDGDGLDFVHLACLARAIASLGLDSSTARRRRIAERMEAHRAADGGYHGKQGSASGTVYGSFLALGAYQDLGLELPRPGAMLASLDVLETDDGAWANEPSMHTGTTTATAAAVAIRRHLGAPARDGVAAWILAARHESGGFLAMPRAPMPDLLSTATALHALSGLETPLEPLRDDCLDFVDTLWTNDGGFYGHWAEERLDCEYTWYGLLALGHLSL